MLIKHEKFYLHQVRRLEQLSSDIRSFNVPAVDSFAPSYNCQVCVS